MRSRKSPRVGMPGTGALSSTWQATGPDHRQHDGGTVGPRRLPAKVQLRSQGDASQCALSAIVKGHDVFSAQTRWRGLVVRISLSKPG